MIEKYKKKYKEQSSYSKPNANSGNLFLTRLRFDRDVWLMDNRRTSSCQVIFSRLFFRKKLFNTQHTLHICTSTFLHVIYIFYKKNYLSRWIINCSLSSIILIGRSLLYGKDVGRKSKHSRSVKCANRYCCLLSIILILWFLIAWVSENTFTALKNVFKK